MEDKLFAFDYSMNFTNFTRSSFLTNYTFEDLWQLIKANNTDEIKQIMDNVSWI